MLTLVTDGDKETIMSQVLPYEENISRYGNDGDEEQMSLTCRLHNTNNFYSSTQNKRPPKLGQIGRSKRGEDTLKSFTQAAPVKFISAGYVQIKSS